MSMSRRSFLGIGSASLAAGYVGMSIGSLSTDAVLLEEITIASRSLPASFHNYRIGFLSDHHLGGWVPHETLETAGRLLSEARIDLLLLGGDYVWVPDKYSSLHIETLRNKRFIERDPEILARQIFRDVGDIMRQVKSPDGRFGVLGNHDRWMSGGAFHELFRDASLSVLQNQKVEIRRGGDSLLVYGTEDLWTGIPRIPEMPDRTANQFRVLLTHNPDTVAAQVSAQRLPFDLVVAGHTHGGQVKWPLVGALHYNIENLTYREGLVRNGDCAVYVSRGLGVVEVPFRLNCPPEATVLTLRRETQA